MRLFSIWLLLLLGNAAAAPQLLLRRAGQRGQKQQFLQQPTQHLGQGAADDDGNDAPREALTREDMLRAGADISLSAAAQRFGLPPPPPLPPTASLPQVPEGWAVAATTAAGPSVPGANMQPEVSSPEEAQRLQEQMQQLQAEQLKSLQQLQAMKPQGQSMPEQGLPPPMWSPPPLPVQAAPPLQETTAPQQIESLPPLPVQATPPLQETTAPQQIESLPPLPVQATPPVQFATPPLQVATPPVQVPTFAQPAPQPAVAQRQQPSQVVSETEVQELQQQLQDLRKEVQQQKQQLQVAAQVQQSPPRQKSLVAVGSGTANSAAAGQPVFTVAQPAVMPVTAATAAASPVDDGTRPKGWDQCLTFARFVRSKQVTGIELVHTWKATCEPAVRAGRASERYRLMCDSLGGAVQPFSEQIDYSVEALCDAVLAVFHDLTAIQAPAR